MTSLIEWTSILLVLEFSFYSQVEVEMITFDFPDLAYFSP